MDASANIPRDAADAVSPDYRSLSGPAVLAFVLGLASPAALISPLLLVVPAAAVGLALLAEGRIRASGGMLAGGALARCGLVLALASAAAAAIRSPVRDELMNRQITQTAREWFEALAQGKLDAAEELISAQGMAMLRPRPEPGAKPTPDAEAKTIADEALRTHEVARCLQGKKTPLTVQLIPPVSSPVFEGARTTLGGDFTVSDATGGKPCRIRLQLVRYPAYADEGRPWRVERWEMTPADASSAKH
jgi:hypothetical protein